MEQNVPRVVKSLSQIVWDSFLKEAKLNLSERNIKMRNNPVSTLI